MRRTLIVIGLIAAVTAAVVQCDLGQTQTTVGGTGTLTFSA